MPGRTIHNATSLEYLQSGGHPGARSVTGSTHFHSSLVRPKALLGLLIPLASAALFVRLGIWQTARHRERAAFNARVAARLAAPPVPLESLPADTALQRGRRVRLAGRFRFDLEQVLAGRANEGAPSVHLVTPLERAGSDTVVAVVRGWVPSPDAAEVDRARWRERDSVSLSGFALPMATDGVAAPSDASRPLRVLHTTALASRFGRPVAPVLVVMTSDSAARPDSVPRRLPGPVLGAGNHRSYAIQWFTFALIAVVGGVLLFRRSVSRAVAAP